MRARVGDYAGALDLREQAYAALRADGDTRAAARLAAYQIAFDHIEEITTSDGIEIVGDRGVLTIPDWFCPREAVGPVVHELKRLILETASKAPLR